ncbi:MAG: 4Fe-4S binding protein [Candidatus Helarchaeota archaeon]|nr:4Fe-4S binding protein [Candidatus Helarchaeota archaeon]
MSISSNTKIKNWILGLLSKILRIMPQKFIAKMALRIIFRNSLNDVNHEIYQKDFKHLTLKVNLNLAGVKAYQIFERTKYTKKIGEFLDDADITLSIPDTSLIWDLLSGKISGFDQGRDENNNFCVFVKKQVCTAFFKKEDGKTPELLNFPEFGVIGRAKNALNLFSLPPFTGAKMEQEKIKQDDNIATLIKSMLKNSDRTSDEEYKKRFHNKVIKVNWDITGILAYQIFEENKYSYEFGKHIEDADVKLVFSDKDQVKSFLGGVYNNGNPDYNVRYKGMMLDNGSFPINVKIPLLIVYSKDPIFSPFILSRIPFIRNIVHVEGTDPTQYGAYIPVNESVAHENMLVPFVVFEHFINKASAIAYTDCPCRVHFDCKNHDHELGCMYMGDDVKKMHFFLGKSLRLATKEEALERVRMALEDGLIPIIGRAQGEAKGHNIEDTGHFLASCFCCTCCCINGKVLANGSAGMISIYQRIEGIEVSLDPTKCKGCGTCLEVCVFHGKTEIENGKAVIDQDCCLGCGRCVSACPNDALSIKITDSKFIDNLIGRVEAVVDVEPVVNVE